MRRLLLLLAAWVLVILVVLFGLLFGVRIDQLPPAREPTKAVLQVRE